LLSCDGKKPKVNDNDKEKRELSYRHTIPVAISGRILMIAATTIGA
jgi:hypothetical protein